MSDLDLSRETLGATALYRLNGSFDRRGAWSLRERIQRDAAQELLIDFTLVNDFSDLAVAVLAQGVTVSSRRVTFRGLRERQRRILRYCGVAVDGDGASGRRFA